MRPDSLLWELMPWVLAVIPAQPAILMSGLKIPRRTQEKYTDLFRNVEFPQAYQNRHEIEVENLRIPFLSKEDIVRNKEATGRDKDKLDIKYLREKRRQQPF